MYMHRKVTWDSLYSMYNVRVLFIYCATLFSDPPLLEAWFEAVGPGNYMYIRARIHMVWAWSHDRSILHKVL